MYGQQPPPSGQPSHHSHSKCPPGMEYLMGVSRIIVDQHVELLEMLTGFETNNRYDIKDGEGIRMYLAVETSDFIQRRYLRSQRNFTIVILNNTGTPVLCLQRAFTSICTCTGNAATVLTPDATYPYGEIVEEECCTAVFSINDGNGNVIMTINGPSRCCCCSMHCGDATFTINDESNNPIGQILKHHKGHIRETISDATTYTVDFPLELDPLYKCLILGAVFLIDFMFFEGTAREDQHRRRGRRQ